MSDLRWHPQPSNKRHDMMIDDGWRDLGYSRRWRVNHEAARSTERQTLPRIQKHYENDENHY